jgi:glycosyltransferase involved in cell wall biosynthesis
VISVIVPVRNGMPWLEEQLRAIIEQDCDEPWEVIVANNNSTDGSDLVAQEWADRSRVLRVVDASKAHGPGATRNAGAAEARGDLLAFCDADDIVGPGWLSAHVATLAEADISAGLMDHWSLNGRPAPSPLFYAPPPATGLFGFLPAAASGNLAIRRSAFEDVGGFAEDLMTGEDMDISWRAQLRGSRFALTPGAVIARRDQQGFKAVFRRYVAYGRSGPILFRRFRSDGLRRQPLLAGKTWVWMLVTSPRLVESDFRDRWARIAGWRAGCLMESMRRRTFFP